MAQQNDLELAKQGNPHAIAALMNRQLQPKGITAKATLKDGCLQIMLESTQVPDQQALVSFICKGIKSLGAESIKTVKVYGRQTKEEFPAWSQQTQLLPPPQPPSAELGRQTGEEVQAQSIQSASSSRRVPLAFAQAVKSLHERTGTRVLDCINALRTSNGDIDTAAQLLQKLNQVPAPQDSSRPIQAAVVPVVTLPPIVQNSQQREEDKIVCPKCKSGQFSVDKKGFGLGKAAAGAVLLGPVGLLGGFMGSDKVKVTCLICGHIWEPGKA